MKKAQEQEKPKIVPSKARWQEMKPWVPLPTADQNFKNGDINLVKPSYMA